MKKLFALTGLFLILFFSGCQENQITEPVSSSDMTEPVASFDKTSNLPSGEWIKLCCPVIDPLTGSCQIQGTVYYNIEPVSYPAAVVDKPGSIDLTLMLNGELCQLAGINDHSLWSIYGYSKDRVEFTGTGGRVVTLSKTYKIKDRSDIVLRVVYNVDFNVVSINKIFLRRCFSPQPQTLSL
jgi:hypothetical protein